MNVYKLLKHDLKNGTCRKWRYYLIPVFLGIVFCIQCKQILENAIINGLLDQNGTWMDYMLYSIHGDAPHINGMEEFILPIVWFCYMMGMLVAVLGFYSQECQETGVQCLLNCRNRFQWWIAKCLWIIVSNIFYMGILCCTVMVFCLLNKVALSLQTSPDTLAVLYGDIELGDQLLMRGSSLFLAVFLLPVLGISAICLLQMYLELYMKPVVAFALSLASLIISIWKMSVWLLGNFAMAERNAMFLKGGINSLKGILICICVILFVAIMGGQKFRYQDVLPKDE